jgi:hypothetical protein
MILNTQTKSFINQNTKWKTIENCISLQIKLRYLTARVSFRA